MGMENSINEKWRGVMMHSHSVPMGFQVAFDARGLMNSIGPDGPTRVPKGARVLLGHALELISYDPPEVAIGGIERDDYVAKATEIANKPAGQWITFNRLPDGKVRVCFGMPILQDLGEPSRAASGAHVTLNADLTEAIEYWEAEVGDPHRKEYIAKAIEAARADRKRNMTVTEAIQCL